MILVIDANVVIAALIKKGKTRELIINGDFHLVAPDFIKEEITKHSEYVSKKAHLSKKEFNLLLSLIFQKIEIMPINEYKSELPKAKVIIKEDLKDAEYVACYLALKCDGIWTNDPDYNDKPELIIIKTEYLLKLM